MADVKNQEELTFPTKRKPDPNSEDCEELPKKAQKLETFDDNSLPPADEIDANAKSNNNLEVLSSNCSSVPEEKNESPVVAKEEGNEDGEEDNEVDNEDEFDDDDDDDDEEEEEEDEDGDESNGEPEVDRKGKGVLGDDKGKGKMIEQDDDSDDDDDDSDLSDDPLTEVDLNNILPSRTRRRTQHPGVHIANELGTIDEEGDSDDSDA